MPRRKKGGCGCRKGGRKMKLGNWAKRGHGKQRGGFIFSLGAIGAAISAALASSTAATVGSAALGAATSYGVTKALEGIGGKTGRGRRRRIRRR